MIDEIQINVTSINGRLVFTFHDGAISFVTFIVTDSNGETLWKVHPVGMNHQQVGVGGAFTAMDPTSPAAAEVLGMLSASLRTEPMPFPACSEVEYGVPPVGYAEDGPAKPLVRGASYSVIVLNPHASGTTAFVA